VGVPAASPMSRFGPLLVIVVQAAQSSWMIAAFPLVAPRDVIWFRFRPVSAEVENHAISQHFGG